MATSAWMKMMDRHDAERREVRKYRRQWPWLGKKLKGVFGAGGNVYLGKPIPYRGYPGTSGGAG